MQANTRTVLSLQNPTVNLSQGHNFYTKNNIFNKPTSLNIEDEGPRFMKYRSNIFGCGGGGYLVISPS
uniref:Uncharacterized protein n=1 Tax=Arundo donax TaxID=35708 RepID=A0A0A9DQW2_ARUDO